jgi:CDP-diacylglycerol--glycerol-3-phosphate 3-phosphatidyltransferase
LQQLLAGTTGDAIFILGFIAFFTVPFLIFVGMVVAGRKRLPAAIRGGAGKRLLGPLLIGYYYWFLGPVFRLVERTRLRPNLFTLSSLGGALAAGIAIGRGHFALASVLLIGGATLDILDGHIARSKKLMSTTGAFLDSTVDRVADGLIFGGCVVYYQGTPVMYVALAVLIATFTVSYARSRGETLGVKGSEGLLQRAERITILGIALAFSPSVGHRFEGFVPHPWYGVTVAALCLLALLATATAVARIKWTMDRLALGAAPVPVRPVNGHAGPMPASASASAAATLRPADGLCPPDGLRTSDALRAPAADGARLLPQQAP